jgi:Cdc6-like AAA superfamily ATPase
METKLQLTDLYLGNIDAKHELLSNSADEKMRFSDSFFMPENIILEDYMDASKYFVTGLKGTGKTALLRYMAIKMEETLQAKTSFILFKSDIKEQERKDFSKAAGTVFANNNSTSNETENFNNEFEDVWMWFIHRHIVELANKKDCNPFYNDTNWKKYVACVTAPRLGDEESGIKKLIPKLKRGNVEVNAGLEGISGTLGLEFDWEDQEHTKVKFNSIVKQANNLFSKLIGNEKKLYIFLDELELTLDNNKKYVRDKKIIRDLIIAIHEFNIICKKNNFQVFLIAAIRSEVLTAVESSGKEINKIISDFATPIIWHQSGGNISNHPILQIIVKRLKASEKFYDLNLNDSSEAIWRRYFPETIQNEKTEKYILHLTWYRPRDVIRLLNIAQNQYPKATNFSHQVFDGIKKSYSGESWTELSEELRAIYREEEIDGIKRLFYGINNPFYYNYLNRHVNTIKEMYTNVELLLSNHKLGEILSNAYRVGLIGNSGKKYRFAHRGDDEILLEKQMMLHRALWASLSIEHNIHV